MDRQQINKFKRWFAEYISTFYGDNEYINANLELKEYHSDRVCREMLYLTDSLGIDPNHKRIAETIALFHDIGRFPQFVKYQTYHDPRSINHSQLGLDVLAQNKILDCLDENERHIIQKAIECHGLRELPSDLDGDSLLFCQLIRDADKIDIYHVVTSYYKQYVENPDEFKFEIELPDTTEYSMTVIDDILNERHTDHLDLRTWNDMKLLQLGWVYDINFTPTLKRIKQRGVLEQIIDFLPKTDDIQKVKEKILSYVDSRIKKSNSSQ